MDAGADQPRGPEPWAIRLPGDEATRKAGENLRAWAGDDRGSLRRAFDRVTGRDERDPKLAGARGEEQVARELARLGDGWTVVHGVRIGPKADVDHVVVGPAGVYSLNTKWLAFEANVHVTARQFRVDGYSRDYYPKAVKEAARVAGRLRSATGFDVVVHPLIVLTGVDRANVRIREQPSDVTIVGRRELCRWLGSRPSRLPDAVVGRLAQAIRRPATWDPSKVPVVLDKPPASTHPQPPGAPAPAVEVVEWRRYGHDRRYVNDTATGARLGWRDERTGEVHVDEGADPAIVHAALSAVPRAHA